MALLEGGAARGRPGAPAGVGDRRRQLWSGCLVHSRENNRVLDAEQLRDGRLDRVVRHRLDRVRAPRRAARRMWSKLQAVGSHDGTKERVFPWIKHLAPCASAPCTTYRRLSDATGAHPAAHCSNRPQVIHLHYNCTPAGLDSPL